MATDKSDISIYIYPEVNELVYNTGLQRIHSACMASAGTPQYITSDSSYQNEIIERADAGLYPVVFYVKGNNDFNL